MWGAANLASTEQTPSEDRLADLREWASHIAAETRASTWIADQYLMPDEVSGLCHKLTVAQGGLCAVIGYQGVGKTSALSAIAHTLKQSKANGLIFLFKWRRPAELVPDLLTRDDNLADRLKKVYSSKLSHALRGRMPDRSQINKSNAAFGGVLRHTTMLEGLLSSNFAEAERMAGKSLVERVRHDTFLQVLSEAKTILIDLPDYSKTDMRRVATDLETIHWIWNRLAQSRRQPNIVITFQKELFRGHFFLGKMNRIELNPLKPEAITKFYEEKFKGTDPYTNDALLLLARMSRGIFRRFLKYLNLTLDHQEQTNSPPPITVDQVREAVPPQLLAEDMDQQLAEVFPKQADQRIQAVKLLLHLEEHGPAGQTEIAQLLNLPEYAISRLLNKLEDNRYIKRQKKGLENIVTTVAP
ncbi:MarR family transcriptional regulator [Candidatus Bathyarchaeota archaeon]|nr:MarR family transcriptional regulator [Candidatus Bathyarchaeota archaeon]